MKKSQLKQTIKKSVDFNTCNVSVEEMLQATGLKRDKQSLFKQRGVPTLHLRLTFALSIVFFVLALTFAFMGISNVKTDDYNHCGNDGKDHTLVLNNHIIEYFKDNSADSTFDEYAYFKINISVALYIYKAKSMNESSKYVYFYLLKNNNDAAQPITLFVNNKEFNLLDEVNVGILCEEADNGIINLSVKIGDKEKTYSFTK